MISLSPGECPGLAENVTSTENDRTAGLVWARSDFDHAPIHNIEVVAGVAGGVDEVAFAVMLYPR